MKWAETSKMAQVFVAQMKMWLKEKIRRIIRRGPDNLPVSYVTSGNLLTSLM